MSRPARLLPRALVVGLLVLAPTPAEAAPAGPARSASTPTSTSTSAAKPAEAKPAAAKPAAPDPFAPAAAKSAAPDPFAPAAAQPSTAALTGQATGNARESEIYGERLDGIEAEVAALKDKIFRSKARLAVLRDTVLSGVMAGGRVLIVHRNLMGSGFRLVRVAVVLDGAQIFARSDETGALDQEDELPIFDGNLPPGPHEIAVELSYQGQGYGAFSYLKGYSFRSASNHSFAVGESGQFKLVSKGYERGNLTTEMKDRPAVDWQTVAIDAAGNPAGAPAGTPAGK